MAAQDEFTSGTAAHRVDLFITAGSAQLANQYFMEHFRRRFGPARILIESHFFMTGAVDDAVFAIEMRSAEGADENGDRKLRGADLRARSVFDDAELIVVRGPRSATTRKRS